TMAFQFANAIKGQIFPVIDPTMLGSISTLLDGAIVSPPLTAANDANTAEIQPIITAINALSPTLQLAIDECNGIVNDAKGLSTQDSVQTLLDGISKDLINDMYKDLKTTSETFMNDLMGKSAPCLPVYQSYENVGDLACKQMTGGVQGMWAAAGLAALFFIPTVIAVFCIASVLRSGKNENTTKFTFTCNIASNYKLPTMSNQPSAPPATDSLPRLKVETAALAGAALHHDSFTATAPLDSSASDPWESSHNHTNPYYAEQSEHKAPFVDPLAYPAAAAAPAATAAAPYESSYPRVNASANKRYYDNDSYSPSTLTRF
ncbi:hypothetical protein PFISCL1PPCAC_4496, partial [Pristionchus fissidentatus]